MLVPDYQSLMLSLLKFAADKEDHTLRESIEVLSEEFNLTEEERREMLPSGQQKNRVAWVST